MVSGRVVAMVRNSPGLASPVIVNGIPNLPQMSLVLVVHHFEIADRRLAARTPVHDVGAAVNQPLLVEPHKCFADRDRQPLVHGEVFAVPVHRRAQALHLAQDRSAVMLPPFPDPLHKSFAAHLRAGSCLR